MLVPRFVPYFSQYPALGKTISMTGLFLAPVLCFVLAYRMNERA